MSEVHERKRLPDTRESVTHRVKISTPSGDLTLFIIVGFYEDGTPGELFINMGKAGSTLSGLLDTIGILCSYALQYGVPMDALAHRMLDISFEPSGETDNPDIPRCSSVIDYIFRWMEGLHGNISSGEEQRPDSGNDQEQLRHDNEGGERDNESVSGDD